MTAQHAERQGTLVARNVAASLGKGTARPYKHRDLGFLVELGGLAAAANPLHISLSGPTANAVTWEASPEVLPSSQACSSRPGWCRAPGRRCWLQRACPAGYQLAGEQERSRTLGFYTAVASAGFASGAVLGGLLAEATWRLVSLVNVPVGLGLLAASMRLLPPIRPGAPSGWTFPARCP